MAKLAFLLGAGAGYVLGARAGRQKYEAMRSRAQQVWKSQPVQDKVATAKHAAETKAVPAAKDAVSTAATAATTKLHDGVGKLTNRSPELSEQQGPSTFPLGGRSD